MASNHDMRRTLIGENLMSRIASLLDVSMSLNRLLNKIVLVEQQVGNNGRH